MKLTINGSERLFAEGVGILEVLSEVGLHPSTALVELNGQALFRHEWPETKLKEGDVLEIIRVVAGG